MRVSPAPPDSPPDLEAPVCILQKPACIKVKDPHDDDNDVTALSTVAVRSKFESKDTTALHSRTPFAGPSQHHTPHPTPRPTPTPTPTPTHPLPTTTFTTFTTYDQSYNPIRSSTVSTSSKIPIAGSREPSRDGSTLDAGGCSSMQQLLQWRPRAIMPKSDTYMVFWYVTVVTALLNAIIEPYKLAFTDMHALGSEASFFTAEEIIVTLIFTVDIVLKFFLSYPDPSGNEMITNLRSTALRYLRFLFVLDVLFMFPFVPIILAANPGLNGTTAGLYVGLLGLLKLGRLYNVADFFTHMDYSMILGQVQLMIVRNLTYILLSCHIFACIFYFTARASGFASNSWVGAAMDRFDGQPSYVTYMNAMYVSVVTFSGLGDSDLYAHNSSETLVMSCFCLFNVFVAAYILGTVTMLMVKSDEKSGIFRGHMSMLKRYSHMHRLPGELEQGMRQHLELHYLGDKTDASDEKLLGTYPPAIKRKVLRHLYEAPIRQCYLFSNLKPKFLDAILASCRTDLFLPNVQLITEGDIVSDLCMLVEGKVEVMIGTMEEHSGSSLSTRGGSIFIKNASILVEHDHSGPSYHNNSNSAATRARTSKGTTRRGLIATRTVSDPIGSVAFFTETPSTETVWTLTVVKVLMISRHLYEQLQTTHPRQVQIILSNLKTHYEKELLAVLNDEIACLDKASPIFEQLRPCMYNNVLTSTDLPSLLMIELRDMLPPSKASLVNKLDMIKGLIQTFFTRKEQQLTIELLDAASRGDDDTIRKMLASGTSPNKGDYDKRTALMVASQEGKENVVKMLLEAGADVNANDIFGTNALVGAVKAGHVKAMNVLMSHGASLAECTGAVRADVIDSILQGDMAMLTRYLDAGTDPDLSDHNKSTLLHVAAGEGNLSAVKLLLAAGSDVLLADRWGNRALDDARRAEAMPVVRLLEPLVEQAKLARLTGDGKLRLSIASRRGERLELLSATSIGTSSFGAGVGPSSFGAAGGISRELKSAHSVVRRGLFTGMQPHELQPPLGRASPRASPPRNLQ